MNEPISLSDLQIVGYADVLTPEVVPSVEAPIFRSRRNPDVYYFPPFVISSGVVHAATARTAAEFAKAVADGCATKISSIAPKPGYELWIDERMKPRYGAATDVRKQLTDFAKAKVAQARSALRAGNAEEADRLAGQAVSADERLVEAWALKAAIREHQGRTENAELFKELASKHALPESVAALVKEFRSDFPGTGRTITGPPTPFDTED